MRIGGSHRGVWPGLGPRSADPAAPRAPSGYTIALGPGPGRRRGLPLPGRFSRIAARPGPRSYAGRIARADPSRPGPGAGAACRARATLPQLLGRFAFGMLKQTGLAAGKQAVAVLKPALPGKQDLTWNAVKTGKPLKTLLSGLKTRLGNLKRGKVGYFLGLERQGPFLKVHKHNILGLTRKQPIPLKSLGRIMTKTGLSKFARKGALALVTAGIGNALSYIGEGKNPISPKHLGSFIVDTGVDALVGAASGYLGWAAGAAVGSAICPGVGTVIGGIVGSIGAGLVADIAVEQFQVKRFLKSALGA